MTLKRTRHLDVYITIKELIEEHPDYSVNRLCKIGHITRASYYKWKNRVANENDVLNKIILFTFYDDKGYHPFFAVLNILLYISAFSLSLFTSDPALNK